LTERTRKQKIDPADTALAIRRETGVQKLRQFEAQEISSSNRKRSTKETDHTSKRITVHACSQKRERMKSYLDFLAEKISERMLATNIIFLATPT
jgi:hypothetical protein